MSDFPWLLSPGALATRATEGTARPFRHAEHLQLLSYELVKLHMREPGWPRRLLVTCPPRHGKSEMVSHWFPVWTLAVEPTHQIILASYEADFAAHWGRRCRTTIEELEPLLGIRIRDDSRAANRWQTPEGGGMTTAGVGGAITGRGGHVLICDDPVKNAEEASSETIRQNTWDWWQTTFLTREQPPGLGAETIVVLVMTRWHEDDLAGRLMREDDFATKWRHVNLPAFAEPHDALDRAPDEPLWPEMFDEAWLREKRKEIGSRPFTALFQQRPAPPEGAGIPRNAWRYYDEDPAEVAASCDEIIWSWDPTFKELDSSDFFAGQCWGRRGDQFFGIEGVSERMGPTRGMKAIEEAYERWPQTKRVAIEETAAGSAICEMLERAIPGKILRITPKGSKEVRLNWAVGAAAPLVEAGQVYLPRNATWAKKLVEQAANFPHGAHDDDVDAFTQGIAILRPRSWAWENQQARLARMPAAANPLEAFNLRMREAIDRKIAETAKNRAGGRERAGVWVI